ncbi:MAG TPA: response regulator [Flavisolibacter sp.]|jgi:CheY-like chemotaxis protein|nr:response regulator [Flavisolibacter sp.]
MSASRIKRILYIDDDSDDRFFLSQSLAESSETTSLVCATGGVEAMHYLNSLMDTELPSLIILDINMPKHNGMQLLGYMKSHPHVNHIPVVILSTSGSPGNKEACARLGAHSYFQKPFHFDGYKEVVNSLKPILGLS